MIRPANAFVFLIALALGFGMFSIKREVQSLEDELARVRREIAETRDSIRVLNAEWSLLNQPARLAEMSRRHLSGLEIAGVARHARLEQLPARPMLASLPTPAPDAASLSNLFQQVAKAPASVALGVPKVVTR